MNKLIRLSAADEKPLNTVQENLTQEDIDNLLEDYEEIENIIELKPGIEIRYYTTIKKRNGSKQKLFRMGGKIIKIDYEKKYLVLSNNKLSWSVQLNDDNQIFRKMTFEEIKNFYENEINNIEIELNRYKSDNKKLLNENQKLKSEMSNIKKLLKNAGII